MKNQFFNSREQTSFRLGIFLLFIISFSISSKIFCMQYDYVGNLNNIFEQLAENIQVLTARIDYVKKNLTQMSAEDLKIVNTEIENELNTIAYFVQQARTLYSQADAEVKAKRITIFPRNMQNFTNKLNQFEGLYASLKDQLEAIKKESPIKELDQIRNQISQSLDQLTQDVEMAAKGSYITHADIVKEINKLKIKSNSVGTDLNKLSTFIAQMTGKISDTSKLQLFEIYQNFSTMHKSLEEEINKMERGLEKVAQTEAEERVEEQKARVYERTKVEQIKQLDGFQRKISQSLDELARNLEQLKAKYLYESFASSTDLIREFNQLKNKLISIGNDLNKLNNFITQIKGELSEESKLEAFEFLQTFHARHMSLEQEINNLQRDFKYQLEQEKRREEERKRLPMITEERERAELAKAEKATVPLVTPERARVYEIAKVVEAIEQLKAPERAKVYEIAKAVEKTVPLITPERAKVYETMGDIAQAEKKYNLLDDLYQNTQQLLKKWQSDPNDENERALKNILSQLTVELSNFNKFLQKASLPDKSIYEEMIMDFIDFLSIIKKQMQPAKSAVELPYLFSRINSLLDQLSEQYKIIDSLEARKTIRLLISDIFTLNEQVENKKAQLTEDQYNNANNNIELITNSITQIREKLNKNKLEDIPGIIDIIRQTISSIKNIIIEKQLVVAPPAVQIPKEEVEEIEEPTKEKPKVPSPLETNFYELEGLYLDVGTLADKWKSETNDKERERLSEQLYYNLEKLSKELKNFDQSIANLSPVAKGKYEKLTKEIDQFLKLKKDQLEREAKEKVEIYPFEPQPEEELSEQEEEEEDLITRINKLDTNIEEALNSVKKSKNIFDQFNKSVIELQTKKDPQGRLYTLTQEEYDALFDIYANYETEIASVLVDLDEYQTTLKDLKKEKPGKEIRTQYARKISSLERKLPDLQKRLNELKRNIPPAEKTFIDRYINAEAAIGAKGIRARVQDILNTVEEEQQKEEKQKEKEKEEEALEVKEEKTIPAYKKEPVEKPLPTIDIFLQTKLEKAQELLGDLTNLNKDLKASGLSEDGSTQLDRTNNILNDLQNLLKRTEEKDFLEQVKTIQKKLETDYKTLTRLVPRSFSPRLREAVKKIIEL